MPWVGKELPPPTCRVPSAERGKGWRGSTRCQGSRCDQLCLRHPWKDTQGLAISEASSCSALPESQVGVCSNSAPCSRVYIGLSIPLALCCASVSCRPVAREAGPGRAQEVTARTVRHSRCQKQMGCFEALQPATRPAGESLGTWA